VSVDLYCGIGIAAFTWRILHGQPNGPMWVSMSFHGRERLSFSRGLDGREVRVVVSVLNTGTSMPTVEIVSMPFESCSNMHARNSPRHLWRRKIGFLTVEMEDLEILVGKILLGQWSVEIQVSVRLESYKVHKRLLSHDRVYGSIVLSISYRPDQITIDHVRHCCSCALHASVPVRLLECV
jgi:hypothetical protein